MTSLEKILVKRDGLTLEEAREQIDECREALLDGDFEAIGDYLGLEDDYIFNIPFNPFRNTKRKPIFDFEFGFSFSFLILYDILI